MERTLEDQIKKKMFEFSDVDPIKQKITFAWGDSIRFLEAMTSFIDEEKRKAFEAGRKKPIDHYNLESWYQLPANTVQEFEYKDYDSYKNRVLK